MTFRPSGYPEWCASGATNVAEPLASKKATGWGVNEAANSSYFNWLAQKQNDWIKYLDWYQSMDVQVDTNFTDAVPDNVGTYGLGAAGGSGYMPLWYKSPTGVYAGLGNASFGDADASWGSASYMAYLWKYALYPCSGEDFYFETMFNYVGETRMHLNAGFQSGTPFAFTATGGSSWAFLHIKPSGVATAMGLSLSAASGYIKASLEAHGQTMIVKVNGRQIYTLRRPVFNDQNTPFGGALPFGTWLTKGSGINWYQATVYKMNYRVKKNTPNHWGT